MDLVHSSADLVAATDRVASAIIEPLRSGDTVFVRRVLLHGDSLDGDGCGGRWAAVPPPTVLSLLIGTVVASVERVVWPVPYDVVPGATTAHRHGANALVIGDAILTDPREDRHDPRIGRHSNLGTSREPYDLHIATGEERTRFADMAAAIVAAFRDLVVRQAADYRSGADAITRLEVR